MKTLKDFDLKDQKVLLRVDFNVPLDENKKVKDATRIREALPTVHYLLEHQVKQVICLAHFGRPKGEINEKYTLAPVVEKFQELLGQPVGFGKGFVVPEDRVVLMENIRFFAGEEKNDEEFSKKLAGLADFYVNDAFGTAHRAHSSTEGVAHYLPHAAGLLMEKEVNNLTKVYQNPIAPVVAIIGGAKISTKIGLIKNLLPKVDELLLGGALANTVLLAQNHKIGKSLVEADLASTVKDLIHNKLRVPVDVVVAKEAKAGVKTEIKAVGNIAEDDIIADIGEETVNFYREIIKKAKTIIWNGPMGLFEIEEFAQGTKQLAQAVADADAFSVLGGGETVESVVEAGLADKISFISTGGGAMLEFLEGKILPGIKALE